MNKTLSIFLTLILLTTILFSSSLQVHTVETKTQIQSIPEIEDPTPGYFEMSEYMIGNCSVPIIFLESDGSIDPETEDWTTEEINKVLSEIQYALDWWSSRNPNANFSFYTEYSIIPTSYETINRPGTEIGLWIGEAMTFLGYPLSSGIWVSQVRDYINAFRDLHNTAWCFAIFVVDSSNDPDGNFPDGGHAFNFNSMSMYMTYDLGKYGIDNMDRITAHEVGNIFWAMDEYTGKLVYGGYLNVSNVPLSGCLMDDVTWCLSGAPHGENGTWGQIGWRDSDGDGLQDIIDTFPRVYYTYETTGNTLNFTGVATVTPYPNSNPQGTQKDITINVIEKVEYRIDNGTWISTQLFPTTVQKLIRFPDVYADKETYAIVNFTFTTPSLEEGNNTLEIRAYNQWGNYWNVTETFTITGLVGDVNSDGIVDIFDVVLVSLAFDSRPDDSNWNQAADINNDDVVDIFDIVLLANNFGKTT